MIQYFLIFLSFILILILFIVPSIWCYDPTLLINLKYTKNLDINSFDKPSLFICSHSNRQHHLDQILVCREAIDSKLKLNIVVSSKGGNSLEKFVKKLPLFPSYNLVYTCQNTVEKCKKILEKNHVWLFLKEDWENKGAYHILKDLNVPLIFVKISSDDDITKDNRILKEITFNRKLKLEYTKHEKYFLEDDKKFLKFVKNNLYC